MRQGQRGFILIEILVVIVLISTALTAAAALYRPAILSRSGAAEMTAAAALAQKQMELLKARPASFWRSPPAILPWQGSETMPLLLNGVEYQVVTRVVGTGNPAEVAVNVFWPKDTGMQSLQLTAFFFAD
ncbi:MAG: type II secretion system protein [Sporomusaceae bacterium]|nr:type II secretion system protein [Sporomusaceae bacterium]